MAGSGELGPQHCRSGVVSFMAGGGAGDKLLGVPNSTSATTCRANAPSEFEVALCVRPCDSTYAGWHAATYFL